MAAEGWREGAARGEGRELGRVARGYCGEKGRERINSPPSDIARHSLHTPAFTFPLATEKTSLLCWHSFLFFPILQTSQALCMRLTT